MRPRKVIFCATAIASAALLAGCGERSAPPPAKEGVAPSAGPSGRGYYKVGAPYQVDGVWYYPRVDYNYDETGIASWYGPDFHGKYTASGEVYNMNDLTAAHPTLPLPSIVRVTNLDNGRSIVVRINDRGPYVRGRVIDLSRRAAQLIGMVGTGTAKVRVQILPDESRQAVLLAQQGEIPTAERIAAAVPTEKVSAEGLAPPPAAAMPPPAQPPPQQAPAASAAVPPPPPPSSAAAPAAAPAPAPVVAQDAPFLAPVTSSAPPDPVQAVLAQAVAVEPVKPTSIYVQVGAFSQYDNASRLRAKVAVMGASKITEASIDGQAFYRVRVGPASSVDDADRLLDLAVRAGYHDARIVVE